MVQYVPRELKLLLTSGVLICRLKRIGESWSSGYNREGIKLVSSKGTSNTFARKSITKPVRHSIWVFWQLYWGQFQPSWCNKLRSWTWRTVWICLRDWPQSKFNDQNFCTEAVWLLLHQKRRGVRSNLKCDTINLPTCLMMSLNDHGVSLLTPQILIWVREFTMSCWSPAFRIAMRVRS